MSRSVIGLIKLRPTNTSRRPLLLRSWPGGLSHEGVMNQRLLYKAIQNQRMCHLTAKWSNRGLSHYFGFTFLLKKEKKLPQTFFNLLFAQLNFSEARALKTFLRFLFFHSLTFSSCLAYCKDFSRDLHLRI